MKAVYNIGYGVYVLTTNASKKNGCIVNAVAQITSSGLLSGHSVTAITLTASRTDVINTQTTT